MGSTTTKVRLGPKAAAVISRRTFSGTLSNSEVMNSMLVRYDAIVDQEYSAIQKKFRAFEILALQNAFARLPNARHRLTRLENTSDLGLFPELFQQGHALIPADEQLTKKQLSELVRMLTTTITVAELSALSDRILAYVNEKVSDG